MPYFQMHKIPDAQREDFTEWWRAAGKPQPFAQDASAERPCHCHQTEPHKVSVVFRKGEGIAWGLMCEGAKPFPAGDA